MKAKVIITLKRGVLDPQGKAIARALAGLGFDGVRDARQGKLIELDLDGDDPVAARQSVEAMCQSLLANSVIEDYAVEMVG
jgi:phosphoribosylformylglycinamidine synthase subunit PurS